MFNKKYNNLKDILIIYCVSKNINTKYPLNKKKTMALQ